MPRTDINKKHASEVSSSSREGVDKGTVIKLVCAILGIGAGVFLVLRSLSEKPNQFVNTPAEESAAEIQDGSATNTDKPKIQVETRRKSDSPKAIGNSGSAKYLPGVSGN